MMNTQQSLFNIQDPNALREAYIQQFIPKQDLSAQQIMAGAGARMGTGLGRMLGGRTAAEAENEMIKQVFNQSSQASEDPVERLAIAAKMFREKGMEQRAMALEEQMLKMRKTQVETQAKEVDVASKQAAARREEELRTELASLPPDATDAQVEAIVRKHGNPTQLFNALERRQTAEANRQARAELELEKAERAEAARQERMQFQQTMAMLAAQQRSATNELQRERIQQQIDTQKEKQQEIADKKQMALDMSIRHANKVITDVAAAKELVGFGTTGIMGKASGLVPGTDAYNLNQRVLTLKANLGFDRLQQMREASPTGGALGQVAVQELEALQASVGSLEIGQSQAELRNNLEKIDKHYKAWLNAVQGARGPEAQGTPAGTPTMRYNPATGKLEPI